MSVTLADALIEAHRLHEARRHDAARQILLTILEQAPGPVPAALSLLGQIARTEGRPDEAVDWFAKAIEAAPDEPSHRLVLASLALERGAFEEAEELCREALQIAPSSAAAVTGIGLALAGRGRHEEALAQFRAAAKIDPSYAPAAFHLGTALLGQGDFVSAEAALRRAVRLAQDDPEALNNLGLALRAQGMEADALPFLERAAAQPGRPAAMHINLADALRLAGRSEAARDRLGAALASQPDEPGLHDALGRTLADLGELGPAQASFRRALALDPGAWPCLEALGNALKLDGNLKEARDCYMRASTMTEQKGPRLNLAVLDLLEQRFDPGFRNVADLWRSGARFSALDIPGPLWDGRPMPGEPLLVDAGTDPARAVMLGRYLPLARHRVGRVVLACPAEMLPLFRNLPGLDHAMSEGEVPGGYSAWAALDCLPALLEMADVPPPVPLPVRRSLFDEWHHRMHALDGGGKIRVGIACGDPGSHAQRRFREIPPASLAPLGELAGITFLGLTPGHPGLPFIRPVGDDLEDLGHALACLSHLDAVVAVDGLFAHLAGALAVPGLILLPPVADWPWGLGETTPWYNSPRLLRAPAPPRTEADWTRLVRRAATELRGLR